MIDKTIPYYNIVMVRTGAIAAKPCLPEGISMRRYLPGDECAWARMECAVGDFDSEDKALAYFQQRFLPEKEALAQRMTLAVDDAGKGVGSCMAWHN